MGAAPKDVIGKVFAVFFPIMAFVVSGFEHCIANMYYIPAGLYAKSNPEYLDKAISTYGYTKEQIESLNWGSFITNNIIPVTLGNIIGGMVFVGVIIYFIDKKELDGTI
jgi:formate/nitrite transporter FocA (FNT family)